MGFSFNLNGSSAEVLSGSTGANVETFLEAVKKGMAQRATSIVVDFSKDKSALSEILEPFSKFSAFAKSKNIKVEVTGLDPSDPLSIKLQALGVDVKPTPESPTTVISSSTANLPTPVDLTAIFKAFDETGELPMANVVAEPVLDAIAKMKELLSKSDAFQKEKTTYEKRLEFINKNLSGDKSNLKDYQALLAEEAQTAQSRDNIGNLKKQLVEATQKAETEDKAHKEFASKYEQDNKKKMEGFKKELEKLKGEFAKIEANFQKKSDSRKAEIQKLQTPPKGAG